MKQENAEHLAVEALTWLAAQEDLLPVFLGSTGASADEIRNSASDPAFLGSVLDFLLMDDAWVVAFCDAARLPYEAPMRAREVLQGGDLPHWT